MGKQVFRGLCLDLGRGIGLGRHPPVDIQLPVRGNREIGSRQYTETLYRGFGAAETSARHRLGAAGSARPNEAQREAAAGAETGGEAWGAGVDLLKEAKTTKTTCPPRKDNPPWGDFLTLDWLRQSKVW